MTDIPSRRALLAAAAAAGLAPAAHAEQRLSRVTWAGDRPNYFNRGKVAIEGDPQTLATGPGPSLLFDGVDDAVFADQNPLTDADAFTIEAIFRPDGGAAQQPWLHLAPDAPSPEDTRTLFEIRVVGEQWYLDAFTCGPGYSQTLADPQRLHPVGQWYHVAQTCDGKTWRTYVNRAVQAQATIAYAPQGPGRTAIGTRLNHVDYFKGAIHRIRFTPRCLAPLDFLEMV